MKPRSPWSAASTVTGERQWWDILRSWTIITRSLTFVSLVVIPSCIHQLPIRARLSKSRDVIPICRLDRRGRGGIVGPYQSEGSWTLLHWLLCHLLWPIQLYLIYRPTGVQLRITDISNGFIYLIESFEACLCGVIEYRLDRDWEHDEDYDDDDDEWHEFWVLFSFSSPLY